MRAFIRAHDWFYANKVGCRKIAMLETGITADYADRAWDEYTSGEIFPRDARANAASIQTLIEISALLRAVPKRSEALAKSYVNERYLDEARRSL